MRHDGWGGVVMYGKVHAVIGGTRVCDGKTVMQGFLSEPGDGLPFCRWCAARLVALGHAKPFGIMPPPGPRGFGGAFGY